MQPLYLVNGQEMSFMFMQDNSVEKELPQKQLKG